METQIAKVIDVKDSVSKTKIIILDKPLDFNPGQWIYVFVEKWGFKIKKPYSIFSLPGENIELLVEDVGYVSSKICSLKVGDEIEISEPLGVFTINDSPKNITFVAFDTGIAPFRSMIQQALSNGSNVNLIYLSEKDDMIYEDYFRDLEKKNEKSALTRAIGIKKEEFAERLKTALKAIGKIDAVYICGLIYLVEDARRVCSELGIENVQFENYV
mgnify:CR=1 FL=1